jgi:hypothetical protein
VESGRVAEEDEWAALPVTEVESGRGREGLFKCDNADAGELRTERERPKDD